MSSSLSKRYTQVFLKIYYIIEAILLVAIMLSTLFAIGNEFHHVFTARAVLLTDILLMFIYLEVLSMVQQFVSYGKIPVRYPIYIAIMAIARYITLGMKELDGIFVVWLSLAALILAMATLVIRFGHHYWPYKPTRSGFAAFFESKLNNNNEEKTSESPLRQSSRDTHQSQTHQKNAHQGDYPPDNAALQGNTPQSAAQQESGKEK